MRSLVLLVILAGPASAHDFYSDLKNRGGVDCCGGKDCKPVPTCITAQGAEGLLLQGQCMPIDWRLVLPMTSPDGQAHACASSSNGTIRCIILPGNA
jgi:hypothetical protein